MSSRGKRVAEARDIIGDPDYVVDGLFEELITIAGEFEDSKKDKDTSDITRDIIIQADKEVEYELLAPVLYTCARAGYGKWNLVALNRESGGLEAVTIEHPVGGDAVVACSNETGVTLIERGDGVAVEYKPFETIRPLHKYDLVLYVGDDWFVLPSKDGVVTVGVSNIDDYGYFVLRDTLSKIKRLHPEYETFVIACDGCVKYQDLIRVLEISVRPEIALAGIFLGRISRPPK